MLAIGLQIMHSPVQPTPRENPPAPRTPTGPADTLAAIDADSITIRVRRYALGLARDPHEADDLAQETMVRVLAAARAGPLHDPTAVAITTATRLWLSRRRGLVRTLARLRALALITPRARAAPADDTERRQRVERAVAALPPMQHAALVLRVVEGLSYDDIAAAIGANPDAVRSNLRLARARLRATLGDEQPGR